MKTIKLTIGIVALAFGAFAFTPAKSSSKPTATADYYINASGQPTTLVDPNHPCLNQTSPNCSATFTVVGGQPTGSGSNIQKGPRL